ncbi:hypothetical protein [Halarcobacter anaerophilus]|jgi:hypothetical protein|uniref:Uncharacterized protein n=1 Tax=Halarcobacter anaerophilus TaxID=877500 RepID=A0A4Q0Y1F7_9BACT|nr:hypothetical protein [Halarcobacter anaerophilus]QDF28569.1 hypothetical protein AANAER_1083 [Halarcobacter anaerophilus]RXJ63295.1 hypothetical protein CRV06_06355 [Halarcobacter anaerophilus]
MSILGKCPYCGANVISRKFNTKGKTIKLYSCENAKKEYDESEQYVFTADSTCTFRVYSNAFLRWNKKSFSENEMKRLLKEGQTIVRLHGRKGSGEYFKYAIADKEYGVSILWEEEVKKELLSS